MAVSGIWKIMGKAWVICIAMACTESLALSVQAAPAALSSSDAIVYEQADEGSNPVENLVEGSTFEYIGDITAEDGSVWHQITTAGGTTGYIRGDREIEIREEESNSEGQEAPVEDGSEPAPSESEPEDGSEGTGESAGEAPENDGDEVNETEETTDEDDAEGVEDVAEEPEDDGIVAAMNMQNTQSKKYIMEDSSKIKERGSLAEINTSIQQLKSKKARVDITMVIGMSVIFFCAGAVYICLNRMKRLKWEIEEGTLDLGRSRTQKKLEKKKRNQKRKAKKAFQNKKDSARNLHTKIPKETK